MLTPVRSTRFKRDVRRAGRRGKDLSKLRTLLELLVRQEPLPARYLDHPLRGAWRSYREAHIDPDWLLIYRVEGNAPLLARTGSQDGEVHAAMKTPRMFYFEKEDVLHLVISDEEEAGSTELSPNVTAELNEQGELIGIEILEASTYMRDSLLDSAQMRLLNLAKQQGSH